MGTCDGVNELLHLLQVLLQRQALPLSLVITKERLLGVLTGWGERSRVHLACSRR
jgi:hypothetical protein